MKKIHFFILSVFILFGIGCDGYKDYEMEYSPAYPLAGNYYVKNYKVDSVSFQEAKTAYYEMYIYAASFEPEKYLWINTMTNSLDIGFCIKTQYDTTTNTFNGEMLPHQPTSSVPDSVTKYITIDESMLELKNWDEGLYDSIRFKVSVYDGNKNLDTVFYIQGHRSSGFEAPYWDNPEGK